MISLKEQIEQEYLYYTHQENGLQNHFSESINLLIKYSNELKSLEKQRSTLLEKYIEDSKEKRDHFLENNQGLIVNIAKTKTTIAPFDDLVSEGNIGMMKALEKFDVESGNKAGIIKQVAEKECGKACVGIGYAGFGVSVFKVKPYIAQQSEKQCKDNKGAVP